MPIYLRLNFIFQVFTRPFLFQIFTKTLLFRNFTDNITQTPSTSINPIKKGSCIILDFRTFQYRSFWQTNLQTKFKQPRKTHSSLGTSPPSIILSSFPGASYKIHPTSNRLSASLNRSQTCAIIDSWPSLGQEMKSCNNSCKSVKSSVEI